MRKHLRRWLPEHGTIRDNRWLAPFQDTLLHPRLWHLNRRSTAGGVAVGLLCGLIPGPLQIASSSVLAVLFKVNLPVAILCTFYTNPLTIVPLYLLAYELGGWVMGNGNHFAMPPEYGLADGLIDWLGQLTDWVWQLGTPLALGLVLLALLFSSAGYIAVRVGWRLYLLHALAQRRQRRNVASVR